MKLVCMNPECAGTMKGDFIELKEIQRFERVNQQGEPTGSHVDYPKSGGVYHCYWCDGPAEDRS